MGERGFALKRLQRELQQINGGGVEGCVVEVVGDLADMHWRAAMAGPEKTAYVGGVFCIDLKFPFAYPMKPPEVRFGTQIYHPNVYMSGEICLDILKDAWAPSLSATTVLLSIRSLLADPNPIDAANAKAGMELQEQPEVFVSEARQHTKEHAMSAEARLEAERNPVDIPVPVKSKLQKPAQWPCPSCTFANPIATSSCEMCGTRRQGGS